eukprot:gnl/TRDRNA2_/TRDRNA2_190677_c0_seq1.p1 gnl/TRDRNA2_/TRDRNA2_190677_c0~~gnl/TRDRNA2_/TRDRNA2_190677_c0_seq1.p1  ORF type:complete len:140 (-),score=28.65 gnl/TRDRNA2_/TRDRNA2_190677_c0_seq1:418-837(-)
MAVSKEALIYSYVFTFAVLMTVMTNVCQYFFMHRPRSPTWWGRWGPFVLMCLATFLILMSPLKNLLVNVCMASFRQNGFDSTIEAVLDFAYMPVFGTKPMQMYTILAYVCMFWSTALQVDINGKFQASMAAYRGKPVKG